MKVTVRSRNITALAGGLSLVAIAVTPVAGSVQSELAPLSVNTPSVVLFLLDDATVADIEQMPRVQALLVDKGASFTSNYSPDPLCCPARATLLTGQYPHNHGVLDNVAPLGGFTQFDDSRTIATYLNDDYRTGLFGKYLNDNNDLQYVPPGWDSFMTPAGTTYTYVDQTMNINGTLVDFPGTEGTVVYGDQVKSFIRDAHTAAEPFFAYVSFVAPHGGFPRNDYPDDIGSPWVSPQYRYTAARVLPDDPSIAEADMSDKPASTRELPQLRPDQLQIIAERSAQRIESLQSVDEQVASVVSELHSTGELDNTFIVFASDNGMMQGQHRIVKGKSTAYEPAAAVPLIIRGPGIARGTSYDGVTGLQDFTPTVLAMTGQTNDQPTARLDGINVLSLLDGTLSSGRPQLIEIAATSGLSDIQVEAGLNVSPSEANRLQSLAWRYRGIVTSNGWKYIELEQTGESELYNLNLDPFEQKNLASRAASATRLARMANRLHALRDCIGAQCR